MSCSLSFNSPFGDIIRVDILIDNLKIIILPSFKYVRHYADICWICLLSEIYLFWVFSLCELPILVSDHLSTFPEMFIFLDKVALSHTLHDLVLNLAYEMTEVSRLLFEERRFTTRGKCRILLHSISLYTSHLLSLISEVKIFH